MKLTFKFLLVVNFFFVLQGFSQKQIQEERTIQLDCSIPISNGNCIDYISNGDFYQAFPNPNIPSHLSDPFNQPGVVPNWYAAQGTPQLRDPLGSASPYSSMNLGFYAAMTAYGSPTGSSQFSEGVAQQIAPLSANASHLMAFEKMFSTLNVPNAAPDMEDFYIVLMHCSDYSSIHINGSSIITPPTNSQVIYCESNMANKKWKKVFFEFTPNDSYDMIWIYPKQRQIDPNSATNQRGFVNITGVSLALKSSIIITQTPNNTSTDCETILSVGPLGGCRSPRFDFEWYDAAGNLVNSSSSAIIVNTITAPGTYTVTLAPQSVPNNVGCGAIINPSVSSSSTVLYNNCLTTGTWPKQYSKWDWNTQSSGIGVFGLKKIGTNDFIATVSGDFSNTLNHNGPIPSPLSGYFTVHYNTTTGISNWVLPNAMPVFALSNGTVQVASMATPYVTSFYDGITGSVSSGPSFVPNNERILAEINSGTYVTLSSTEISLRTASGSSSYPFQSAYPYLVNAYFNPNTNTLFVSYTNQQYVGYCAIFKVINGNITLVSNPSISVFQVTNNDKIITTNNQGVLEEYDYTNGSSIALNLPGINNNGLTVIQSQNQNASDDILILQEQIGELNYFNLFSGIKKTIAITQSSSGGGRFFGGFLINGSQVIISGQNDASNFNIGNQSIISGGSLGGNPQFISVFDLNTDFYRTAPIRNPKNELVLNNKISVSPNPAQNFLNINLDKFYNNQSPKNSITINDSYGRAMLQKTVNAKENRIDISSLKQGIYHINVLNTKGETVSATFIKE